MLCARACLDGVLQVLVPTMAPEDKAAVLQPWLADPLKSPASSNVAKHVLLEHQLQSDAIAAGQAVSEPVKPAQQTNGSIDQSSTSVSEITLPPPPPLLPLQPPDAASLLPIPGQFPASRPGSSGKRRGSSESGSDDEDEATMSKKELRMRRNRESAAR